MHYGPSLPILATVMSPRPELVRRVGAYDFLAKPLELNNLFRLLARGQRLLSSDR